ncbi:MAG: hypothetical protein KDE19_09990 [Caldilineaceae bacterium]|nr:hypothetical protein [Caldilineaceae bacterium]
MAKVVNVLSELTTMTLRELIFTLIISSIAILTLLMFLFGITANSISIPGLSLTFIQDAILLKQETGNRFDRNQRTTFTHVGFDGIRQKSLNGTWSYSPDNQYAVSRGVSVSSHGIRVIRTDTFAMECSDIGPTNMNDPLICPFLQLHNGKWWSPTQGVVLDKPVSSITTAIGGTYRSPDQEWLLVQTTADQFKDGEWVYGGYSVVSKSGDRGWSFEVPSVGGHFCSILNGYSWHENSTYFVISHGRQNHTFVWNFVDHDKAPELVNTIDHGFSCSMGGHWVRGEFLGPWE